MSNPGLVDEYVLPVSPIVLRGGPRLFDAVTADNPLRLIHAEPFPGSAAGVSTVDTPAFRAATG